MTRVPSLARSLDDLIEITCGKDWYFNFFIESGNTACAVEGIVAPDYYHFIEKIIIFDMTTRNRQLLIKRGKETARCKIVIARLVAENLIR